MSTPNISKAARRVLEFLRDNAEEEDLVWAKRSGWWIGGRRITRRTVDELLRLCLITEDQFSHEDFKRYYINGDSLRVLKDAGHIKCILHTLYPPRGKKCLERCSHQKI